MAVGKPFKIDKTTNPLPQMTKLQAFIDFWIYIGFCAAYVTQVRDLDKLETFKDNDHAIKSFVIFLTVNLLSNLKNWLLFVSYMCKLN